VADQTRGELLVVPRSVLRDIREVPAEAADCRHHLVSHSVEVGVTRAEDVHQSRDGAGVNRVGVLEVHLEDDAEVDFPDPKTATEFSGWISPPKKKPKSANGLERE